MTKKYSLAIVTRTKNRLSLLARAIDSLEQQTNQEFVHVIMNDGGDKNELEAFLKTRPRENRIVLHNAESQGLVRALNKGIQATESDLVAILDDDDTWHPERVAKVTEYLSENPRLKAAVVKMDTVVEEIIGDKVNTIDQYPHPDGEGSQISLYKQCHRNYLSNGIVTYRKDLYDELSGYDESLVTAEDWDFGIRLLLKTDVGVVESDGALFYYHQRPNQAGDQGNSVHARVKEQERAINEIRNRYLRKDISDGVAGVGFIMNMTEQDINNTVRLEGHINRSVEPLGSLIDELGHTIHSRTQPTVRKIAGKIAHKLRAKS